MCLQQCGPTSKRMKRSITIGFDARHAVSNHEEFGAYSRLVIEAMALAAPRYTYFRTYIPTRTEHPGYESIERLHNIETMEPDGSIWRSLTLPWRMWRIARDLNNGNVELYHGLAEHIPVGLHARNIRSVVTIHNMEFLYDNTILNSPSHLINRIYMSHMLHRVDRIVAVSECVKRDIIKHFRMDPDRIDVVHNAVAKRFTESISEEKMAEVRERYNLPERYILGVGAHLRRRNMLNVITALPFVDSDLHYVVVGRTTSHTSRLTRCARERKIEDRLHLIESVSDEDMPAVYKGASMLINISSYEGFATSIAEAMTVGVPVISTRTSSMEEVAGDAAIYVTPNNRDSIVSAINRLLSDETLREQIKASGAHQASHFRPEVMAYNLTNCYRRLDIIIRG